jgi:uncharacterized protein (TIGR02757 family)
MSSAFALGELRRFLERLYESRNHFSHIFPDPLQHVYRFQDPGDRELAGFLASCFAFGRVQQINRHLHRLFATTGRPTEFLAAGDMKDFAAAFEGWRYRFTDGADTAHLMLGLKRVLEEHGTLAGCFLAAFGARGCGREATFLPALVRFVGDLRRRMDGGSFLVADPEGGSALKRLNLFLRWMVRRDAVDPGLWPDLPAEKLIVPLDAHMHRFGRMLGFTGRKHPDLRTALEVTEGFRRLCGTDPVRYDFSLTREGISGTGIPGRFVKAVSKRVA